MSASGAGEPPPLAPDRPPGRPADDAQATAASAAAPVVMPPIGRPAGPAGGASGDRAVEILGDVSGSQIITGDGNVVTIDRRSIRVGTRARILAGAGLLVLLLAALVILYEPIRQALSGPVRMNGVFNVAMTELRFDPANCPAGFSAEKLSTVAYQQLRPKLLEISQQAESAYYPERAWSVQSGDDARELGDAVNADAVVYGDLRCGTNNVVVVPRVYLTGRGLADQDAAELIGAFRFGAPIDVRGNPREIPVADELLRRLTSRSVLLGDLLLGLSRFASSQWDLAGASIHTVLAGLSMAESASVERDEDLAVLHLFLGKVATQQRNWPEARAGFTDALRFNPDFPRAELGLAEVAYHEAVDEPADPGAACTVAMPDDTAARLESLIQQYERVVARSPEPDVARLALKSHFYLGRAHLCLAVAHKNADQYAGAETHYRMVTDAYESASNVRPTTWCRLALLVSLVESCVTPVSSVVKSWAAEAYAGRGLLRANLLKIAMEPAGRDETARDQVVREHAVMLREAESYYRKAIDLAPDDARAAAHQLGLVPVYGACKRNDDARAALGTAIALMPTAVPPTPNRRATYEAIRRGIPAATPSSLCDAGASAPGPSTGR